MTFKTCLFFLFLLFPQLAFASDFSGLFFILYLVLFIPPSIFALIIWGLNRKSGITRRIKWFMALPYFILLTPAPMGPANISWPSAAVLLGGSLKEKGVAVIFILILIFIVWCYIKANDQVTEMEWKKRIESDDRIKKADEAERLLSIEQRTKDL